MASSFRSLTKGSLTTISPCHSYVKWPWLKLKLVRDAPLVNASAKTDVAQFMSGCVGADMVAPSDMMDGRIGAIRKVSEERSSSSAHSILC